MESKKLINDVGQAERKCSAEFQQTYWKQPSTENWQTHMTAYEMAHQQARGTSHTTMKKYNQQQESSGRTDKNYQPSFNSFRHTGGKGGFDESHSNQMKAATNKKNSARGRYWDQDADLN